MPQRLSVAEKFQAHYGTLRTQPELPTGQVCKNKATRKQETEGIRETFSGFENAWHHAGV